MSIRFNSNLPAALALLAVSLWATQATAQTPAIAAEKPVAAPAVADAAPPPFRTALEGYQRYTEEKTVNWKEANDTAARIGGWRAYAKEASQKQVPGGPAKPDSAAAPAKP